MKTLTIAALLSFLLVSVQTFREPWPLVFENSLRPHFSVKGGIVELRGGGGWLRTTRLFSDFKMTLEFRLLVPDSNATVILRGQLTDGAILNPTCRVHIPKPGSAPPPAALVSPKQDVKLIEEGRVLPGPVGDWQRLDVVADGARLRVTLNGTLAGVYEGEPLPGYVAFTNAKGTVQLRDIQIVPIEHPRPAEDASSVDPIVKQGGTPVRLLREVKPEYPADARKRGIEGLVRLEVVLLKDGSAGAVGVLGSVDLDLDLAAVRAARRWKFTPATLNGRAVSTVVHLEMSFTLPQ